MGCCRSRWLHWELPQCQRCAGLQHRLLGTQGRHSQGHWNCLRHQRPRGFLMKPCRQGISSSTPQQQLPKELSRGARAGAAGPLLTLSHDSLQLHYSPPIEKVIQKPLGITHLTGLQPSGGTHSQGSRALLKGWISRASVCACGSWEQLLEGTLSSLPWAVPLPACVTPRDSPAAGLCCHRVTESLQSLLAQHSRNCERDRPPQAGPSPTGPHSEPCFWDNL